MEDELYRLIPEEGKHLADSHDTEDAVRGVYLDDETNKPCGAGEFVKVNLDELMEDYASDNSDGSDENNDALAIAALIGIGIAIGVAAKTAYPHVKSWITEKAIPGVKKVWNGLFHKDKNILQIETSGADEMIEFENSHEISIEKAVDDYKENMTSEEAKRELLEAFMLYVLSAHKLRKVSNAQIIKVDGEIEDGTELIEKIIQSGVIDEVNSILTLNPDLLEDKQMNILSDILGYHLKEDDKYIPIDVEQLEHRLLNAE